jgi:crotonobetainyl-CoA:carnitine CoA-transferase CaiB-like acyl-CoA transferase
MGGALSGIRVLDFTRYQQGPYATSLLADMGAEVIKIEPRLDGEWGRQTERDEAGFSAYFESYNRGKRSITIDIRRPEGRAVVERLAPHVDVLVENFRPGFMERVGLGYERLRLLNPRLIYAAASAFGPQGPLAERPGYDHIAQAVGGLMVEQGGGPGHEPQPALPGAADQVSAMLFAFSIASALVARERTGEGQRIDVSLLGSMMAFQGRQITRFLRTGQQGRARFRRSPVYSHYRAQDGWVAIAAQDPKRWLPFCRALGRPDMMDDPRFAGPWERHHHADELETVLEEVFARGTVAEWIERLTAQDVPCGPVNDYRALTAGDELAEQLTANGYLATVDHPNLGTLRTAGIPIQMSGTPPDPVRPAPELGQDTEDVLLAIGYTWEELEQLRRDEVI